MRIAFHFRISFIRHFLEKNRITILYLVHFTLHSMDSTCTLAAATDMSGPSISAGASLSSPYRPTTWTGAL